MQEPEVEVVPRLKKADAAEASQYDREQAQALVGLYYDIQGLRKAMGNRLDAFRRRVDIAAEPGLILDQWANLTIIEQNCKKALLAFAQGSPLGRWALSNYGLGEVIAAGLLAHVDVARAPTAGAVWRFAGLDPTCEWEAGCKRPFNAQLKTICWNLGECFKKFSHHPDCFYGALYRKRKQQEVAKNEAGDFAPLAASFLEKKKTKRGRMSDNERTARSVWESGKLQAGGLDLRTCRWAVKIFLSHYHHVGRKLLGLPVSTPWAIQFGGHVHEIAVPNWPMQ